MEAIGGGPKPQHEKGKVLNMKLGIIGAIALTLGVWAMVYCWWFVVEIIQGLVALGLVVGGTLTIAIAIRRICREKATVKQ